MMLNWGGFEAGVVRVLAGPEAEAEPLGSGFLVSERRALTCAHVVQGYQEVVYVSFLTDPEQSPKKARVLWRGNPEGRADDVAVLELAEAPPAGARSIAVVDHVVEDRFVAVGFPAAPELGAAVHGSVVALVGGGWVQIEAEGALVVDRGFSGTAAWNEKRGAAVGMVVARGETTEAYMIPTRKLREALRLAALASVSPWVAGSFPALVELCRRVELEASEIREFYAQCSPRDWPPLPRSGEPGQLLVEALHSLADAPRQSTTGGFPLAYFVRSLADHAQAPIRGDLERWLEEAKSELGETKDLVQVMPMTPSGGPYYILVKIEPPTWEEVVPGNELTCQVGAYLLGTSRPASLFEEESTLSAEWAGANLHRILRRAMAAIEQEGVDPREVQFEFLLPYSLLGLDVDSWELRLPFETVPVGANHPVVVRSLERDRDSVLRAALGARWEYLRRQPDYCCATLERNDLPEGRQVQAVFFSEPRRERYLHVSLSRAEVLCVALPKPPAAGNRLLGSLLQAGVPAALWARREVFSDEDICTLFQNLIVNEPLLGLPMRIFELRMAAANEEGEPVGRHLTLLWDDPTRPFPDRDGKSQLQGAQPREDSEL